jgi:hypothetical protein
MNDMINHPPHYITAGGIEAIDVIERYGFARSFHLANAMKYLLRAGRKGDLLSDLRKADWYLARWLERGASQGYAYLPWLHRSDDIANWCLPEEVCAAFEIEGPRAQAVKDLLWWAMGSEPEAPRDSIRIVRVALGVAIASATREMAA